MANVFTQADEIVQAANLLLQREIVLPATVTRLADASWANSKPLDDTVTLSVPAVITSRSRTMRANSALTADDLEETKVPVKLTKHIYKLLNVTDEDATLSIRDFASQVLQPQIRAVAEGLEDVIADALGAATWEADAVTFDEGTNLGFDVLIAAGKELNKLNAPRSGRFFVCGADVEAALFGDDRIVKANEAGTDTALREALIARLAGFTVVGSNALAADEAYAYHQTAICFGNVAPTPPRGAAAAGRMASNGFAMRYVYDYNPAGSSGPVDRSLVDAFAGAKSVEEGDTPKNKRGVAIDFTAAGS